MAALDRLQRRRPALGVPIAVVYKFFDQQGNYLAAMITYYAFVAVFPLMLLGTSILGFVLQGRPELQEQLLESAFSQFPVIGDQLGRPGGLGGSTTTVVAGLLVSLYGATGLGQALQNAQNVAWSVPRNSRPNPFLLRLRSLLLLIVVGLGLLAVSVAASVAGATGVFGLGADSPWLPWLLGFLNFLIVGAVLTVLLRLAAAGSHHLVRAAPGAFALAFMWQVLQALGAAYVTNVIAGTSAMNQTFGIVLGLVGMIYIGAVMAMLGITINVVLALHLYPRALLTPFTDEVDLTEADRRVYEAMARAQRLKGFEVVSVEFEKPTDRAQERPPSDVGDRRGGTPA